MSEDLWDRANLILEKRSNDVKSHRGQYNHGNLLSCKMFCTHCGSLYHRTSSVRHTADKDLDSSWMCSNKKKHGKNVCPSRRIYETEIKQVLFQMFQEFGSEADAALEGLIDQISAMRQSADVEKEILKTEIQIEKEKQKRTKLLQFNLDNKISDEDFLTMSAEIKANIADMTAKMEELTKKKQDNAELRERLARMKKMMESASRIMSPDDITPAVMDAIVDKIEVTTIDETHIQLDVFLNDGSSKTTAMYKENRGPGRPKKSLPLVADGSPCTHPHSRFRGWRGRRCSRA